MGESGESLGDMAAAGLLAREIDRARSGQPAVGHPLNEPCANCGTMRVGEYCHACGQAGHVHRSLGALVHDISHGVFHFEGKIWKTLPMLGRQPGELTRRYVHGERAKFVSPMALFLFSVFLMFAVVSNIGVDPGESLRTKVTSSSQLAVERSNLQTRIAALQAARAALPAAGGSRAGIDAKIASAQQDLSALQIPRKARAVVHTTDGHDKEVDISRERLSQNGFDTGLGWFDRLVSHAARNPELAAYKLKSYGYKYSWALIPISLPFIWLLFCLRRDVGLYDHAIFSIYSLSFMSLGVVVLVLAGAIGVPSALIALTAIFVPPVHMYRQLKGAYLLGWFGAAWRTLALLIITSITLSLFLSFIVWMGTD
ncbi:hypothetical protein FHS31_001231 [Sphingomonas vulcanisoli]|uniref:DUF3667 domain-containing protein n=1 Tax=Sphingomonas vulcanisoli TaxID=1658060 RepID=A0ABX0TTM3_9SPHN|nr:DUF3667 domain-containing protein [Sphingomonas vulcanisoli]NIJ07635.1 hypothetical protein [Sphingomonas vulcanisoli]